jgi:two-component sensor histidine kinase
MPDEHPTRLTEEVYEVLLENMSEGFVICEAIRNDAGRLVDYWRRYLSPSFIQRVSQGLAEEGYRQLDLRPETPPGWMTACHRALRDGRIAFEYVEPANGRWYEVTMLRVSENVFAQLYIDIHDRKLAEQHRDQLFQELNHRVKNNLAVVSSILDLQARQGEASVRAELSKAVDRIRAIADLHAALQSNGRSGDIELAPYVETLGRRLAASVFAEGGGRLEVSCPPVRLPTETAVNLGLILNELVTNSAKHGAAGRGSAAVRIDVQASDAEVRVVVADDGPGFPDGQAPTSWRLGWRLVQSVGRGMGAEIGVLPGPGARVEVRLPRDVAWLQSSYAHKAPP